VATQHQSRSAKRIAVSGELWSAGSRSATETERIGRLLGASLKGGEVIALYGDLGTGKTVLVRGLAAGLGAPAGQVSSPTFVLINEYTGRVRLTHADLYRMDQPAAVDELGLWERADGTSVLAIEWAENAGPTLPPDHLEVRLTHRSARSRAIAMTAHGRTAAALLARFRARYRRQVRRTVGRR
jgi:tRNA threonylcarbamoyladenosine biosynthesis protein TsaE